MGIDNGFRQWGLKEGKLGEALNMLLQAGHDDGARDRAREMLDDTLKNHMLMPKGVAHGRWGLVLAIDILVSHGFVERNDYWDSVVFTLMREVMFLDYGAVPYKISAEDDFIAEGVLCVAAYNALSDKLKRLFIIERMISLVDEFEYLLNADLTLLTGKKALSLRQLHSMAYFLIFMQRNSIYPVKTMKISRRLLEYCMDIDDEDNITDSSVLSDMAGQLASTMTGSPATERQISDMSLPDGSTSCDLSFFRLIYRMPVAGGFGTASGIRTPANGFLTDRPCNLPGEAVFPVDESSDAGNIGGHVTFIMTLRVDSPERLRNFKACVSFLLRNTDANFIVTEADVSPKGNVFHGNERVRYIFEEDRSVIFHRTFYINKMLRICPTKYAAVWDVDAICDPRALATCIGVLRRSGATMAYPFNGQFWGVSNFFSNVFANRLDIGILTGHPQSQVLMAGYHSVGGAFAVDVEKYRGMGWENQNFEGWGPEDMERYRRLEICGQRPARVNAPLYHLDHPRGINSNTSDCKTAISTREEYRKVCAMNPAELKEYIESWDWTK